MTVKGRTISEYVRLAISDVINIFSNLELTDREYLVSGRIIREILERLRFLDDVGVGYLSLDRSAATLSGGEGQRIRLATQIGAKLVGVLYVLDEPSVGLHASDVARLIGVLGNFADNGNTVVIIEHHPDIIKVADHIIDLGPEGGIDGGHIIAYGTPEEVAAVTKSYTGQLLRGLLAS